LPMLLLDHMGYVDPAVLQEPLFPSAESDTTTISRFVFWLIIR
jgi:hypothetical protein